MSEQFEVPEIPWEEREFIALPRNRWDKNGVYKYTLYFFLDAAGKLYDSIKTEAMTIYLEIPEEYYHKYRLIPWGPKHFTAVFRPELTKKVSP